MIDNWPPAPGMEWNGVRWVWPNPDGTPVGPNDAGGPPPIANKDIATNAGQILAWLGQAQEIAGSLSNVTFVGGLQFTEAQLAEYVQQHAQQMVNLLTAITESTQTIQRLASGAA
ncbi:MAG: hypothetical protein KGL39_11960 [Patescibacteria group bacterium]|nr:hypothetical protein [Patescibacteria group bacterium]